MTIKKGDGEFGVDVQLTPDECELFIQLASDLEKLQGGNGEASVRLPNAKSYFSLSVEIGKRIGALTR